MNIKHNIANVVVIVLAQSKWVSTYLIVADIRFIMWWCTRSHLKCIKINDVKFEILFYHVFAWLLFVCAGQKVKTKTKVTWLSLSNLGQHKVYVQLKIFSYETSYEHFIPKRKNQIISRKTWSSRKSFRSGILLNTFVTS